MKLLSVQPFLHGPTISPSPGGRAIITHALAKEILKDQINLAIFPHKELVAEDIRSIIDDELQAPVFRSFPHIKDISTGTLIKELARQLIIPLQPQKALLAAIESIAFKRAVSIFEPDIVHFHNSVPHVLKKYNFKNQKTKIVTTEHKKITEESTKSYDLNDVVIFITRFQMEEALHFKPNIKDRSQVIYNYASSAYYEHFSQPDHPIILYLASLNTLSKGFDILLASIQKRGMPDNAILHVIGDGHMRKRFELEAQDLIKAGKIKFLGRLDKAGNVAELRKASLLVVPSRTEGFGNVYAEALCMGVPIIGYHKTIVELDQCLGRTVGLPFDSENESIDDLWEKMNTLLSSGMIDEKSRQYIALKAREKFSFKRYANDYLALYKKLLGGY